MFQIRKKHFFKNFSNTLTCQSEPNKVKKFDLFEITSERKKETNFNAFLTIETIHRKIQNFFLYILIFSYKNFSSSQL